MMIHTNMSAFPYLVEVVTILTSSDSSILNDILSTASPTLWNNLITPAPLKADVLVDLGKSPSRSKKSRKSGSILNKGWDAVLVRNLFSNKTYNVLINIKHILFNNNEHTLMVCLLYYGGFRIESL